MAEFNQPELSEELIHEKFPLHSQIWKNEIEKLDELLTSKLHDHEIIDPHGRTPLLLAVALGYEECVDVLLKHSCDASAVDTHGWTVTQEGVATGNYNMLSKIIQHREFQRCTQQKSGSLSATLDLLEETEDFYVEMKWEFSTAIPLISKMFPSDSYKIYKSGANVRVDTTLKGFEQMDWQRGNQSFIFKGGARSSEFFEVDHDKQCYWRESINAHNESMTLESLWPPPSVVNSRLSTHNVTSVLEHENISFTRQKSGFLGWGSDKTDQVNGYSSKVFDVAGVQIITRTRTEHLSYEDRIQLEESKKRNQSQTPALLNFFVQPEQEEVVNSTEVVSQDSSNPYNLSLEDYFNPKLHPGKDVGLIRKMKSRTQKFSATVALADDFPLSLQDQVLPIINLMANSNSHFAKLRDFITLQLPAGFPIKIEIPLFHVLKARITFNNVNGSESCPNGIVVLQDAKDSSSSASETVDEPATGSSSKNTRCMIDRSLFEVHRNYRDLSSDVHFYKDPMASARDEEDDLLQLAIQQSLMENSTTTGTELTGVQPSWLDAHETEDNDEELERVLRESLNISQTNAETVPPTQPINSIENLSSISEDEQIRMAMLLSVREDENQDRLRREEEEEMARILALSLTEN